AQVGRDKQEIAVTRNEAGGQPSVITAGNVTEAEDERRDLAPRGILVERARLDAAGPTRRTAYGDCEVGRQPGFGVSRNGGPVDCLALSRRARHTGAEPRAVGANQLAEAILGEDPAPEPARHRP